MRAPTDQRQSFRQWLAGSQHPAAAGVRAARGMLRNFTLPAPRLLVLPYLWLFLALRWAVFAFRRLLVAEPLFKAYCTRVGRGVTTGIYVPWIQGKGELLVGDGVHVSGKLSINFAARFCRRPRLEIGNGTDIAHECRIVVGKEVVIGARVEIASNVTIRDSGGHPADEPSPGACHPAARRCRHRNGPPGRLSGHRAADRGRTVSRPQSHRMNFHRSRPAPTAPCRCGSLRAPFQAATT